MSLSWTPIEDETLAGLYQTHSAGQIAAVMGRTRPAIKNRVRVLGLKKPEGHTNTGRFEHGFVPWNKGHSFDSGGRSHETRFKPGRRPHTWRPIGHERVTRDGYCERKMTDTGVTRVDFVGLHIMLWREHHGDIPDGCAVVFRNNDKTDIRIDNLDCITRAELMRRNSYHSNYPPAVRSLIQLRGAVTRQINNRTRKDTSK